jgi:hypothetical protein
MDHPVQIPWSGLHSLPKGVTGPCDADIYDGFAEVTTTLE